MCDAENAFRRVCNRLGRCRAHLRERESIFIGTRLALPPLALARSLIARFTWKQRDAARSQCFDRSRDDRAWLRACMRASPHSDFAFGARPGVRNNRAQTVWNSAAHAVDSSNAHIFIAGRVSTKTFPGDGSYQRKPANSSELPGCLGFSAANRVAQTMLLLFLMMMMTKIGDSFRRNWDSFDRKYFFWNRSNVPE